MSAALDLNELAKRQLEVTRLINAPRALVFQAFTDAKMISNWWGPNGFRTTTYSKDVRPGGAWRFTMHGPDGHEYANESVFVDVTPPARVRLRHVSEPRFELLVTLAEEDGGTQIRWRHRFASVEECARVAAYAGPKNEENLDRWVEEAASA